ncbi:hypothetical protein [Bailinhaonella thermotolerans]|uniref:hypothetical protein n=1 Tax=Bailinhaonella thermotolerans TaxID=1070861 RepID=UPI00192A2A57|nr:hypothetical protein [Bailinhaonella thermotolerans]
MAQPAYPLLLVSLPSRPCLPPVRLAPPPVQLTPRTCGSRLRLIASTAMAGGVITSALA